MKLKAIIHKADEGGFWAEVPALPGCVTQGETMEELQTNLHEAIEGWLSVDAEQEARLPDDQIIEVAV
jgi:predicted RNase H-like HicB family nuclease